MTRIVTVVVAPPPELVAVTVYVVAVDVTVGVPEIAPVELSMESPAVSDGEIDHETTVPPLEVGVEVVIGVFFVNVRKLGL